MYSCMGLELDQRTQSSMVLYHGSSTTPQVIAKINNLVFKNLFS